MLTECMPFSYFSNDVFSLIDVSDVEPIKTECR